MSDDDSLPSLRRPTAWETPARPRQLTSPHSPLLSDGASVHSADEPHLRTASPSVWRPTGTRGDWYQSGSQGGSPGVVYSRRQVVEAQEQLRMCKEELARKERLISELSSLDTTRHSRKFDSHQIDDMVTGGHMEELSAARSQIAALQVKVDGLQSQIRELNHQLESRDERIGELVGTQDLAKDAALRQTNIIQSLHQHITDCEARCSDLEEIASRKELVISTLQRDHHEAQQHILELETQLRVQAEKHKQVKEQKDNMERAFIAISVKLDVGLSIDVSLPPVEPIIRKVEELIADRASHHGQLESLKINMEAMQHDLKASHEMVTRLTAERDELQRSVSMHIEDVGKVHAEQDTNARQLHQLQHDVDRLRSQVNDAEVARKATEHDRAAAERERDEYMARVEKLERELHSRDEVVEHDESRCVSLVRHLRQVLATVDAGMDSDETSSEANIVEGVRHIVHVLREKSARIELLEQKVADLSTELDSRHREPLPVSSDALHQLEKRLRRAEDELAAGDVLRDNLRADKEKFLHFLEHLSRTLGMDTISADVGLDGTTDAVLVRAEQLVRSEAAALAERKTQVYNLQRKLKVMKDQLDSKDVHMELLRKKTVSLEERLSSKTDLEREKDAESVRSRKLMKLAEKYKRELNETHAELRDLRARLLHSTEVQGRNIKLEQDVERLEMELHRLEQIRQQQASSLGSLQETVSTATHEHSRKHDQASNTISALTSELRTTKQALEDVTKREQQLVDLRNVVARMLGLSIDTLAVPDYEVIARLEQLILANQTNAATAFALDTAFAEVGDAFRSGYHDATHRLMVTGGRPSSIPGIPGVHHRRKVETVLH